jgi:uncharacterized membrane protein (DUF485 family)
MKNQRLISIVLFILLASFLSFINYNTFETKNLTSSIVFGCLGSVCIFIIPYAKKKWDRKNEENFKN